VSANINKFSGFLLIGFGILFASPKIQIDSTTFHCGTIIEGKTDQLKASFTVKNVGDQVLNINVKPTCGCTIVKYDSIIKPMTTSIINAAVNLNGYHKGRYSKTISVTSNDTSKGSITLTIDATIQSIIDVSVATVNLNVLKSQIPDTINIYSGRKNLEIVEVFFKPDKATENDTSKISPIPVKFALINTNSTRPEDGNNLFKLQIYPPSSGKLSSGKLIVKTNQADKSVIVLNGNLAK
jgi:hypothetical protein